MCTNTCVKNAIISIIAAAHGAAYVCRALIYDLSIWSGARTPRDVRLLHSMWFVAVAIAADDDEFNIFFPLRAIHVRVRTRFFSRTRMCHTLVVPLDYAWLDDDTNQNVYILTEITYITFLLLPLACFELMEKSETANLYSRFCRCQFDNHNSMHFHQPMGIRTL